MLTSVKYHRNLYILILLNQRLALTRLRATGPWILTIFLDRDGHLHCRTMEAKYANVLFLSAIMHRKVTHVNFFGFFSAIFTGPRKEKYCFCVPLVDSCRPVTGCRAVVSFLLVSFQKEILKDKGIRRITYLMSDCKVWPAILIWRFGD